MYSEYKNNEANRTGGINGKVSESTKRRWSITGCNVELERETVSDDALGHTAGAPATCTTAQTCTVCGTTLVIPTGHSFTDYTYNNDKTCTTHGTKTATCDNGCGETNTINDENNLATGHVDGEWTTVADPTCTAEGKQVKKCTVCGETTKEGVIPTVSHTESDWIIDTPAGCLTNGAKHTECTVL